MTWQEFKAAVEQQGIQDDDTIFSIDLGNYPNLRRLRIEVFHLPSGERDIHIRSQRETCAQKLSAVSACGPMLGSMYGHADPVGNIWRSFANGTPVK